MEKVAKRWETPSHAESHSRSHQSHFLPFLREARKEGALLTRLNSRRFITMLIKRTQRRAFTIITTIKLHSFYIEPLKLPFEVRCSTNYRFTHFTL